VLTAKALYKGGTGVSAGYQVRNWATFAGSAWRADPGQPMELSPADGSPGAPMDLPIINGAGGATACPGGGTLAFTARRAQAYGVTYELVDAAAAKIFGSGPGMSDSDDGVIAEVRCSATGATSLLALIAGSDRFLLVGVPVANDGTFELRDWAVRGGTVVVTTVEPGGQPQTREVRFDPAQGYVGTIGTWTH
jgi:hypothetical protein